MLLKFLNILPIILSNFHDYLLLNVPFQYNLTVDKDLAEDSINILYLLIKDLLYRSYK
jgi:hypothetical protein